VEFRLPAPLAVLDLKMPDGALTRVRRHGNPAGPRLIMSHGNGFAIDAYFPFWRHYLRECDVIVYDQRNHGWNPHSDASGHTQAQMADDLETIMRAVEADLGKRKTAGAFHSLSTTVSLLHALKFGFQWSALILFDPPLAPPPGHPLHATARNFEHALSDWSRQRRQIFPSVDALAAYFKGTRRMSRWVPGAAELMAQAITRPTADGHVALICPPEFEADIYRQNSDSPAWTALPGLAKQLFVVCSDYDAPDADPPGLVSKALHDEFGIAVVPVRNGGHLLQLEQPEEVGKIVRSHLHARGFDIAAAR
jgi:pimeloyl-ACP methyl ester carboxylesterase